MFNTEVQEIPEQTGLKVRQLRAMLAALPDDANVVPRFALIPADDAPSVTIEGLSVFQENDQPVLAVMVSLSPLDDDDDDDDDDDGDGDDAPSGCERCGRNASTETIDGELLCSECGADVEMALMLDAEEGSSDTDAAPPHTYTVTFTVTVLGENLADAVISARRDIVDNLRLPTNIVDLDAQT